MGSGWNIHLLAGRSYRPTGDALIELFESLRKSLESTGPLVQYRRRNWTDEEELAPAEIPDRLRAAAAPGSPSTFWQMENSASDRLFGNPEKASHPDDVFFSDVLQVGLTPTPIPYGDWEFDRARCPACRANVVPPDQSVGQDCSGPVACKCGVQSPQDRLKYSWGVPLSQLSIAFILNKGWVNHFWFRPRWVFKDKSFLAGVERILRKRVKVVAIST